MTCLKIASEAVSQTKVREKNARLMEDIDRLYQNRFEGELEIIKAGLFAPVRIHLDKVFPPQELLAAQPGFGIVAILAKKVREVNYERFRWDLTLDDVLEANSHYPKPET